MLLLASLSYVVGYAVEQPRGHGLHSCQPSITLGTDLGLFGYRPFDGLAYREELGPQGFQPVPESLRRGAVIAIVAFDRLFVLRWNVGVIGRFQPRLRSGEHGRDLLQRYASCERIERLQLLDRITLHARAEGVAYDRIEVNEDLRAKKIVQFPFPRRVSAHQSLQRGRLIRSEVIDMKVGKDFASLCDEVDEALERDPFFVSRGCPVTDVSR